MTNDRFLLADLLAEKIGQLYRSSDIPLRLNNSCASGCSLAIGRDVAEYIFLFTIFFSRRAVSYYYTTAHKRKQAEPRELKSKNTAA